MGNYHSVKMDEALVKQKWAEIYDCIPQEYRPSRIVSRVFGSDPRFEYLIIHTHPDLPDNKEHSSYPSDIDLSIAVSEKDSFLWGIISNSGGMHLYKTKKGVTICIGSKDKQLVGKEIHPSQIQLPTVRRAL